MSVLPKLIRRFKILIIDAVVVVLTGIRRVVTTDLRASVIGSAAMIGLKVLAVAGDQQVPGIAVHKDRKWSMHHVPPHVVELLPCCGLVDAHGKVPTAASRTVTAKNFARLQSLAGHMSCGFHMEMIPAAAADWSKSVAVYWRILLRESPCQP